MKKVPTLASDAEAEAFLDQDLSDLDFTQFRSVSWEAEPKSARLTMRLPEKLMSALKTRAAERGIPYQRLVREALEREIAASSAKR